MTVDSLTAGDIRCQREGPLVVVTIAHPGRLNAITMAMWQELAQLFGRVSLDPDARCVVVRGADGNFSAGADITEFPALHASSDEVFRYHEHAISPALRAVAECRLPTIALLEGVCMGGGLEIACQCDLRIAALSARFGAPISRLGFPMAPGEMTGLLMTAGRTVTMEILLEGRVLSAREAVEKGLLTRVVEDAAVEAEALLSARQIAAGGPLAARINKQTLRRLMPEQRFDEIELRAFYSTWAQGPEHHEGVRAFLEKRRPDFETLPSDPNRPAT